MGVHMFIAATTASGAGYNPLAEAWIKDCKYPRRVVRIALAGSAVLGDIKFVLKYRDRIVAELYPTTVGAVKPDDDDMVTISSKLICWKDAEIKLEANGNATTNSVYGIIETQELPELLNAGLR
jgi:hypothetical protein